MTGRTFTDTSSLLPSRAAAGGGRAGVARRDTRRHGGDHGSGAPSCAAARLAASGNRASLSAAVAAGILAIGDEHGGAGSDCMELIAAGLARSRSGGLTLDAAAESARGRREGGRTAPARVRPSRAHTRSPHAGAVRPGADAGSGGRWHRVHARRSSARSARRCKPLTINIDGALAAVLHDMGYPSAAGRLIFIVGRVAGMTAEVAEELTREKPMRIRMPVVYDGEAPRSL